MLFSFQPIVNRLQNISLLLNEIDFGDMEIVHRSILNTINNMSERVSNLNSGSMDERSVDRIRDQIVRFRVNLRDASKQIEETQIKFAQYYRQEIGEQKEQFEKLSALMQEQFNPRAFMYKYTFAQLSQLLNLLNQLNGDFMDVGGSLEQEKLSKTRNDYGDATQDGDSIRYNNDPARPTLSP